jgi:hypothetical protein
MKDKCNMRKYEEKIYSLLYALHSLKQIRNNNDSTKFEFFVSITFRL